MRIPRAPHRWNVTPTRAVAIQRRLASAVRTDECTAEFGLVAGADIAFSKDGALAIAGIVVWNIAERRVVEMRHARRPLTFPYVPGLLTFREGPALLAAVRTRRTAPDAFLFDGQGLAHPRRFGLASHMGVILDIPSAGCGKSRLIGEHADPARSRGSRTRLTDQDETVGAVVRTRIDTNPVFVSVGHRMSLRQAVGLVLACTTRYRIPEPTRLADQYVARLKHEVHG